MCLQVLSHCRIGQQLKDYLFFFDRVVLSYLKINLDDVRMMCISSITNEIRNTRVMYINYKWVDTPV